MVRDRRSGAEQGECDTSEDVVVEPLLSVALIEGLLPVGWRELEEPVAWPTGQQAEQVAHVREGLDTEQSAAGDEGDEGGVGLGAVLAAHEEPVATSDDLSAQVELTDVVVHRQPTVIEEAPQRTALVGGVADGASDRRFVENEVALLVAPGEELVDDGLAAQLPTGLSLFSRSVGQSALDLEQRADQSQGCLRALGVGFERLEPVPSAVSPARDLHDVARRVEVVVDGVCVGDEVAAVVAEQRIDGLSVVAVREAKQDVLVG